MISDVDYLHSWTLGMMEGVMIQGLQLLNQGVAMVDSIARPALSKVGSMTEAEGRQGS